MECSRVDFPDPFSPWSTTRGCERSTIIGMWKFRLVKTGCPRILRCIASHQDSRAGWGPAQTRRRGLTGVELLCGHSPDQNPVRYRLRGVDRSHGRIVARGPHGGSGPGPGACGRRSKDAGGLARDGAPGEVIPRRRRGGMGWETWEECPHEWGQQPGRLRYGRKAGVVKTPLRLFCRRSKHSESFWICEVVRPERFELPTY